MRVAVRFIGCRIVRHFHQRVFGAIDLDTVTRFELYGTHERNTQRLGLMAAGAIPDGLAYVGNHSVQAAIRSAATFHVLEHEDFNERAASVRVHLGIEGLRDSSPTTVPW